MSTTHSAEAFVGCKIQFIRKNEDALVPRFDPKTGAKREVRTTVQAITAVIDINVDSEEDDENPLIQHYFMPLIPDPEIYEDIKAYSLESWLWEQGDRRIWSWLQDNKLVENEKLEYALPTDDRIKEIVVGFCVSKIERDYEAETFIDEISLDSYDAHVDFVKSEFKKIFPHITVAPSLYMAACAG